MNRPADSLEAIVAEMRKRSEFLCEFANDYLNVEGDNLEKWADRLAALSAEVAPDFADDARNWGDALNEAAWLFTDLCPEKSALLFNNTKAPLRDAILKYAELIADRHAAATGGMVLVPREPTGDIALTPQPPAAGVELFIAECYANGRDGSWEVGDAKTRNRIALCFSKADAERVRDALTTPTPAAVPDAVRALRRFVGDAEQVDLGGGDAVVMTTCESLEMAKTALSAAPENSNG